VSLCFNTSMVH